MQEDGWLCARRGPSESSHACINWLARARASLPEAKLESRVNEIVSDAQIVSIDGTGKLEVVSAGLSPEPALAVGPALTATGASGARQRAALVYERGH